VLNGLARTKERSDKERRSASSEHPVGCYWFGVQLPAICRTDVTRRRATSPLPCDEDPVIEPLLVPAPVAEPVLLVPVPLPVALVLEGVELDEPL
jgi:hypothetical protein